MTQRELITDDRPAVLRIVVEGDPVPKGRPRSFIQHKKDGTPFVTTTTPPKTRAYEKLVKAVAAKCVKEADWSWSDSDRFHIILRVYRQHWDAGGDLDNIFKSAVDAIIGVAVRDDRYVRGIGAMLMPPDRHRPRLEIEVRRVKKERTS